MIDAGKPHAVRIHLALPSNASGTTWFALLIDAPPEIDARGMRVATRVAVPVFITADGTESAQARLTALQAVRNDAGEIVIEARVRNSGNVVLRAPMTFAIESGGSEIASADVPDFVILPGGERVIRVRMHGELKGDLSATAFYRYGGATATMSCNVRTNTIVS